MITLWLSTIPCVPKATAGPRARRSANARRPRLRPPAPKESFGIQIQRSASLSAEVVRQLATLDAICHLSDPKDSLSGTASLRRAPAHAPAPLTAAARINTAHYQALAELTAIARGVRRSCNGRNKRGNSPCGSLTFTKS